MLRRVIAHRAVGLRRRVAQLEHLAQHRHVAAGQRGEQIERGDHRVGRGVVGVVEDAPRPDVDAACCGAAR